MAPGGRQLSFQRNPIPIKPFPGLILTLKGFYKESHMMPCPKTPHQHYLLCLRDIARMGSMVWAQDFLRTAHTVVRFIMRRVTLELVFRQSQIEDISSAALETPQAAMPWW